MNCIVKLSNNDSWYFYYDTSNGICFCKLDSQGVMGESGILSADSPDDFDVICDDEDSIHMCCQNSSGDIVYFRHKNNTWNKTILLKSKSNSTKKKQFRLFSINSWINLLYVLEYRGKNMLTHHVPERSTGEPEVIDYIGESYTASVDSFGNIHVFYDSEINTSFGYKTYTWSQKSWSDFTPTPDYDNCDTMLTAHDDEGSLKITASRNKEIHFISDGSDTIISTGEKPVFFCINNTYVIQWSYREKIYSAISRNNKKWEKSGEYPLSKRAVPEIFKTSFKSTEISAEYCYGYKNGDRVVLLGLENISCGNESQTENTVPIVTESKNVQYSHTEKSKNDYSIALNRILTVLNSSADTLSRIEKRISSCEGRLENIEAKIKELPVGSSKKRRFNRE